MSFIAALIVGGIAAAVFHFYQKAKAVDREPRE